MTLREMEQGWRPLPSGTTVLDVAVGTRSALIAFMELAERGGDRRGLAAWLIGPYRRAIGFGPRNTLRPPCPSSAPPSPEQEEEPPPSSRVDPMKLGEVIFHAARGIDKVLHAFLNDPDLSIAPLMLARGLIEQVCDEDGSTGYAPLGPRHMRLGVRVLALTTADLLTRPTDLRDNLIVEGGRVRFRAPAPISGIRRRVQCETVPYVGEPSTGAAPSLEELVRRERRG